MLLNNKINILSNSLLKLGHTKEASDLQKSLEEAGLTPTDAGGFSFTVPTEIAVREGLKDIGLNESLLEEEDISVDLSSIRQHALSVLKEAKSNGFRGNCAEAAIAINDVLFDNEGLLVVKDDNKGGEVYVKWGGSLWNQEGEKELSSDYSLTYPSRKELINSFGGCNLSSLTKRLEIADRNVRA